MGQARYGADPLLGQPGQPVDVRGALHELLLDQLRQEHPEVEVVGSTEELAASGELSRVLREKIGPDYADTADERTVSLLTPA